MSPPHGLILMYRPTHAVTVNVVTADVPTFVSHSPPEAPCTLRAAASETGLSCAMRHARSIRCESVSKLDAMSGTCVGAADRGGCGAAVAAKDAWILAIASGRSEGSVGAPSRIPSWRRWAYGTGVPSAARSVNERCTSSRICAYSCG